MKGIVLEAKGSHAIILMDDGAYRKVRNHCYGIGQEIVVDRVADARSMLVRCGLGIAAGFALIMISSFAYFTPAGYVSLDVNPSIEYSINLFDRVLCFKALNEDAEELLGSVDFRNMPIGKALEQTTVKLIENGYITDADTNDIYITTTGKSIRKAEKLAVQLEVKVRKYVDQHDKTAEVDAEAIGLARVEEARKLQEELDIKVTPGKLNLVQKLINSTSDDLEISALSDSEIKEWATKPVKEIQSAIKAKRIKVKAEDKDSLEDSDIETEKEKPGNGGNEEKSEKKAGEKAGEKAEKKEEHQTKKENKEAGKKSKNNGSTKKENEEEDDKESGEEPDTTTKPEKTDKGAKKKDTKDARLGNNQKFKR